MNFPMGQAVVDERQLVAKGPAGKQQRLMRKSLQLLRQRSSRGRCGEGAQLDALCAHFVDFCLWICMSPCNLF
jgi:hypothetical protein